MAEGIVDGVAVVVFMAGAGVVGGTLLSAGAPGLAHAGVSHQGLE